MKNKKINKLIIKKSVRTYYRMLAIFILIFVIISSYSAFYIFSRSSNAKNFYDNKNARLIKVKGKTNNNVFGSLKKEDLDQMQILLDECGKNYKLSSLFKISSGILNAEDEKGVIIYGIDDNFTYIMSNGFSLQDDVLYSDLDIGRIRLIIPNIEITVNGDIISKFYKEVSYEVKNSNKLIEDKAVKDLFSARTENLPVIFSSQKTFLGILKIMFDNQNNVTYGNEEIYDFIDVAEVFVYMENIHSIDFVVDKLESNNYYVTYAFDSFENFGLDLFKTSILYNVILLVVIILSVIYFILTYKNYLKSQQKDIGILKHFGYDEKSICAIYSSTLYNLITTIFALISIFNIFICLNKLSMLLLITLIESAILFIIGLIIRTAMINKVVKKDILFLLKYGKEFE